MARPAEPTAAAGLPSEGEPVEPAAEALGGATIRRRALSGVALVGLRGVAIRALGFLSAIVLARLLAPSDFGVLAFGQAFIGFTGLLGDVGVAATLIRRPEPPSRRELQAVLAFQLMTSVPLVLIAAAIALLVGGRAGAVTALMLAGLPIAVFRTPTALRLERSLRYGQLSVVEILETLTYVLLAVGFVSLGFGVWGVAAALVLKIAAGTLFLVSRDPDRILAPRSNWKVIRGLLDFGVRVQAANVLLTLRAQGVNLATAAIAGLGTLGLWSIAERVMFIPFILFDSLWRVTLPAVARLIEAGEDPVPDLERSIRLGAVLTGLLLAGISAAAPLGVPAIFGPEWTDAAGAIPLACLGLVFHGPVSAACSGWFYATGNANVKLVGMVMGIAAWAVVGLPLLPVIGAAGNGAGWLAASIVEGVFLAILAGRRAGLGVFRNSVPFVVLSALAGAAGLGVSTTLPVTVPAAFLAGAAGSSLLLVLLLVFCRPALLDALSLGGKLIAMMRRSDR